jgi:hypothetical protein
MNIIRRLAVRSYRKELIKYIDILSTFNEEKLAKYFVHSVWLRAILQLDEYINPLKQMDSSNVGADLDPELHAYPLMLKDFMDIVEYFNKRGETSKSYFLILWIHTLRGIIRPEIRKETIKVWDIILKSKPYWNERLDISYNEDIQLGLEKEFVEKTLELSKEILNCVPPKQLYQ